MVAGLFSFLFSGEIEALMLSAGETSGIMPVTKKGLTPFEQKGSDPFWVAEAEPVLNMNLVLDQTPVPPLDISGIVEIQKIPVGKSMLYIQGDSRPGKFSMEKILDSITNLAVMQFNVENFTITIKSPDGDGKEETIIGGEFGRILRKEILGFDPKIEIGLRVKHTEFVQTPGLTPKFDEDKYELWISGRQIELILVRDFGRPDKGFPEWGVAYMVLKQYIKDSGNPPKTEERSFYIDKDRAYYEIRILAPDGKLISWEKWKFLPGNPNPVDYWKGTG
jgi:hypothetical protein